MKSPVSFLRLHHFALALLFAILAVGAQGQVAPAGVSGKGELDVFAMYKYTNPDLIVSVDHGITYGAEFKLRPRRLFQPGIAIRGENDFTSSYVRWGIYSGGPELHILPYQRLSPYVDVMFGLAPASFPGGYKDTGTVAQTGAGGTFRVTRQLSAIGDFQYHWVDFGTHKGVDTTFTPWSMSFGVQYRIF